MKYTYRMPFFRAMDADAVVQYLERKAARGWRLEEAGNFFWRFRRAQPARLTYAVTYFPDASLYGGIRSPEQQELADYCAAAGWAYVTQWLRMQIYCTDQPDPVPLDTDEAQKLETVRAVFRKDRRRNLFLLAIYLLECILMGYNFSQNPLGYLSSPMALLYVTIWPGLVLLTAKSLLSWGIWLRRSRRSVERGGPCISSLFRLSRAVDIIVLLAILFLLVQATWHAFQCDQESTFLMAFGFAGVLLVVFGGIIWWMRRDGNGEKEIRTTLMVVAVVLAVGYIIAVVVAVQSRPIEPAWYYETDEIRYGIYDDPIPITLADLGVDTGDLPYSTFSHGNSCSPLVTKINGQQECPPEEEFPGEQPHLAYTIVHVSFPPVYDLCREDLMWWNGAELVSDPRWQAQAVYASTFSSDSPMLLVCWEWDILFLDSGLIPHLTQAQIDTIRSIVTGLH